MNTKTVSVLALAELIERESEEDVVVIRERKGKYNAKKQKDLAAENKFQSEKSKLGKVQNAH